ncbi:hypothetical protein WG904_10725 [Pedobacter sp. Du54]|uniref:hypothetical protein n=1 Tax=Pedobacter anseongensis TaxID=3133439 RepID=UPI0030A7AF0E
MELDIETKQQLTDLLAKPSMVSDAHIDLLADLVEKYPYYEPLHLLLAKANQGKPNFDKTLTLASLYNGGYLAYQMANNLGIFGDEDEVLASETARNTATDEQETFEEIADIQHILVEDNVNDHAVFEEISEVDTSAFAPTSALAEELEKEEEATTVPNELAIESIVASDFFAFEQHLSAEPVANESEVVVQPEEYNQEAEAQTVSKYNDDKLPYTFLWWLAKTRKEHEQIFQPYVSTKQNPPVQQGDLQHQYVEHIFHLQSPFNLADEAKKGPLNVNVKPKGIEIIDSFIKNDPQIKAPKAEQINTENKAKKSAEDNYDLVSETLAAIYIEQMLYHKAIDTYQKLSLKFPEKSRYFADLIQSLEKKI